MNGNRPTSRQWIQLARGIPLAGLLALSACTSDARREIPQTTLENAGAATGATTRIPAAPGAVNNADARESRNLITATRSEEKPASAEHSIFFSNSDAGLSEDSKKILRQHAEYLKQNPKRIIVLRAYLDSLGSRTFSLAIVQKRLDVVIEALREQGVAKSRTRQVMLGQRGRKLSCDSSLCQNREQRIELIYK